MSTKNLYTSISFTPATSRNGKIYNNGGGGTSSTLSSSSGPTTTSTLDDSIYVKNFTNLTGNTTTQYIYSDVHVIGNIIASGDVSAFATNSGNTLGNDFSNHIVRIASSSQLGHIRVGNNLTIDENGILSANAGGVSSWNDLTDRPTWLNYSTQTLFEAGHSHNLLYVQNSGYTGGVILTKLLTVDGAGSSLDADLLDGQHGSFYLASSGYTGGVILTKLLTVDGAGSSLDADLLDGQHGSFYLASSGYTAANVLTKLLTVDGASSGLDADLLDGQHGSFYLASSGYTAANVLSKLLTVDGAGSSLDADLLDGQHGSYYLPASSNAVSASKLLTARAIAISGDGTGTINFDGSANVSIPLTLATVATSGTYKSVTVNAKGLVTSGTNPTTLAGYGITDAQPASTAWNTSNLISPIYRIDRLATELGVNADNVCGIQTFSYQYGTPVHGPLLSFGGLGGAYDCQICSDYYGGNHLYFRTHNADLGIWNSWHDVLHADNTSNLFRFGSHPNVTVNGGNYLEAGSYNNYTYIQSHMGQTLYFNPLGNNVKIGTELTLAAALNLGTNAFNLSVDTSSNLLIKNNAGTTIGKLDQSGNFYVVGNITAYATL
jgi:hypothetical protein